MSKHTILIVDDERIAREILEGYLTADGYNLRLVKNGHRALDYLEQGQVDLILLDVMMPYMDGFEVCRHIKANERWRHIPIILITAFWEQDQMARGTELGANGFLKKPINRTELRTQVSAALELTDIADLKNRSVTNLSGGEKQRTIIARALAQDTPHHF